MAESQKKHFKIMTNAELKAKQQELENKNSLKADKRANKAFRLFLCQANAESEEYQFFEELELVNQLSKFWCGACTADEEYYSVNSLKSFNYGINRVLKKHGHAFDIMKSPGFAKCMKDFDLACLKLKQQGKGFVKNYIEIEDEGKYSAFSTNIYILYLFLFNFVS